MKSILICFAQILLLTFICQGQKQVLNKDSLIQSAMIWSSNSPDGKQANVAFRKTFDLDNLSQSAILEIFADSRYMLWINGQYVLRGPCRFNPKRPEYDVVDVQSFLKKGKNTIVVLAQNNGNAINGRIMKHVPGLTAILEISGKEILRTDNTWRTNEKTRYVNSESSWNTIPDVIDARIDNGEWMLNDFDDSSRSFAKKTAGNQWGMMYPREIPLPTETELTILKELPSGRFLSDVLPLELTAGQEILVDFGQMAMAYTSMDLNADEGSQLKMKYALRYANGKPSEMYGGGNTYTARAGLQSFITTDQWCSHYMLIKCISGRITLLGVRITDRRYPFERIGRFTTSEPLLNTLWEMAIKTIEVTSDDGYGSDARERNEWIQDASKASFATTRVATAGPGKDGKQVFSDPRLLKNMLRHAAQMQLPNGQLLATFPTDRGPEDCHYVIEDYSSQWFEALQSYYEATGDKAFIREMWTNAVAQIDWFLANRTPRGLLLAREYTSFDNPLAYITCEGATINAFFYEALRASAYLAKVLGEEQKSGCYQKAADELKTVYNKLFWNKTEGVYNAAFIGDKIYAPTVHAQLIALHYGLVPGDRKASVQNWFLANYKNPGMTHCCTNPDFEKMVNQKSGVNMPVVYYWVFTELYRINTEKQDQEVIQEIIRRWSPMVHFLKNTGTLAESFMDDNGVGSTQACHNYGAVPAYFLSSYILGVRMDGPVWKKQLLIEPRLGDLSFAEGIVVTEYGAVAVSWKRSDNGKSLSYSLSIPNGVRATVRFPKLSDKTTLILNGEVLMEDGISKKNVTTNGRWIVIQNVTGELTGKIN
jgi:hypothetical protein